MKGENTMKRLAHFIYYKKNIIIAAVILLNIIALISFYNFRFSTDYLSFFKGDHDMSAAYDEISKKYQGIETIQILIETNEADDTITSKENLKEIARYMNQLEDVEGITFIQSFLPKQLPTLQGIIHIDEVWIDTNYNQLLQQIDSAPYTRDLLSEDKDLGLIIIGLEDLGDKDLIVETIQAISIDHNLNLDYAGNQIIIKTIFDYLWKIILTLPPLAILLVLTVFYFNIRVRKLTILAMLPAAFGALWTFGTIFILPRAGEV